MPPKASKIDIVRSNIDTTKPKESKDAYDIQARMSFNDALDGDIFMGAYKDNVETAVQSGQKVFKIRGRLQVTKIWISGKETKKPSKQWTSNTFI